MASGLAAKRLELLKEAVPTISQVRELEQAARAVDVHLVRDIRSADDLPAAFDSGSRERVEGVITTAESIFAAEGIRVVELAAQHKIPGLYPYRLISEAGGLIAFDSYTPSFQAHTANYVDKILRSPTHLICQ